MLKLCSVRTADFQPIEICVQHGVDDVTYPMRKDQFCLRLQTVCREDRTAIKSGRDYHQTRVNKIPDRTLNILS